MNKEQFILEVSKLGIEVSEIQMTTLDKYYQLLVEWNKVMNLTTIIEEEQVYLKHFYDSLTLVKAVDLNKIDSFCDIGTGAGFPGMVIKIFFPHINVVLVDSLNKRINFLKEIISQLKLTKIEAIHSRAEDFARLNLNKFDVVSVRAVASLNILLEYSIPILKKGGYFVPLKANISSEIESSKNALKIMGSSIVDIYNFELPIEKSERNIIKIIKNENTNKKFPRSANEIKKRPL